MGSLWRWVADAYGQLKVGCQWAAYGGGLPTHMGSLRWVANGQLMEVGCRRIWAAYEGWVTYRKLMKVRIW